MKEDMNRNPRLKLPEDPNLNIWNYYTIMKITPIVMDDFLLILLTIPLTDQSLEMDLYKIYNLPTLHPKLKIKFTYQIEGEYYRPAFLKVDSMQQFQLPERSGSAKLLKGICA